MHGKHSLGNGGRSSLRKEPTAAPYQYGRETTENRLKAQPRKLGKKELGSCWAPQYRDQVVIPSHALETLDFYTISKHLLIFRGICLSSTARTLRSTIGRRSHRLRSPRIYKLARSETTFKLLSFCYAQNASHKLDS